jgi:hypothetical protein
MLYKMNQKLQFVCSRPKFWERENNTTCLTINLLEHSLQKLKLLCSIEQFLAIILHKKYSPHVEFVSIIVTC